MSQYSNLGAEVLILIRNGTANDWESLCAQLGIPSKPSSPYGTEDSALHILWERLVMLRDAGLIIFSETNRNRYEIDGKIEISPNLQKVQRALDISLTRLAAETPGSMTVKPMFGVARSVPLKLDIFVLMPFIEELRPVYQDHIAKVAESLHQKVARADDFFTTHAIMQDIWLAICNSRLIIADCTNRNPNVFYEIGLAHTIGKTVILITQNEHDVPFDLRHLRFIQYVYTPRGMVYFEERLTETIRYELLTQP